MRPQARPTSPLAWPSPARGACRLPPHRAKQLGGGRARARRHLAALEILGLPCLSPSATPRPEHAPLFSPSLWTSFPSPSPVPARNRSHAGAPPPRTRGHHDPLAALPRPVDSPWSTSSCCSLNRSRGRLQATPASNPHRRPPSTPASNSPAPSSLGPRRARRWFLVSPALLFSLFLLLPVHQVVVVVLQCFGRRHGRCSRALEHARDPPMGPLDAREQGLSPGASCESNGGQEPLPRRSSTTAAAPR